jgi:hypothetical protein
LVAKGMNELYKTTYAKVCAGAIVTPDRLGGVRV